MVQDLYERLSKLRLMAAVLYDQGTLAGLSEEEKQESIQPLRHKREELIKDAIKHSLGDVVSAVKKYQLDAEADTKKARFHQEKSLEASTHAQVIMDYLKEDMLSKGSVERIQGNYMSVITDGKLEVR